MIAGTLAVLAVGIGTTACGGTGPAQVSAADATAVSQALIHNTRPIWYRTGCFNIRRGVTPDTRHAFAVLAGVARKNLDALLQNPDDATVHTSMRDYVTVWLQTIDYCMAHEPSVGPGWKQIKDELTGVLAARATTQWACMRTRRCSPSVAQ